MIIMSSNLPENPKLSLLAESTLKTLLLPSSDRPFEMRSGADDLIEEYSNPSIQPSDREKLRLALEEILLALGRSEGSIAGSTPLHLAALISFTAVELRLPLKVQGLLKVLLTHMERDCTDANDLRLVLRGVGRMGNTEELRLVWHYFAKSKDRAIRTLAYQNLATLDVDTVLATLGDVVTSDINLGLMAHRILRTCGSAEALRRRLEKSVAAWANKHLLAEMLREVGEEDAARTILKAMPLPQLAKAAAEILREVRPSTEVADGITVVFRKETTAAVQSGILYHGSIPGSGEEDTDANETNSVPRIDVHVRELAFA